MKKVLLTTVEAGPVLTISIENMDSGSISVPTVDYNRIVLQGPVEQVIPLSQIDKKNSINAYTSPGWMVEGNNIEINMSFGKGTVSIVDWSKDALIMIVSK